jgi:hypothetical protein
MLLFILPHRCCALRKERRDINVVPTYPCSQLNPVSPILSWQIAKIVMLFPYFVSSNVNFGDSARLTDG